MSLPKCAKRITAGLICKIAAKSMLRCGWPGLIVLCFGFYMLFPGAQALQSYLLAKSTPYEQVCTTNEKMLRYETLSQMEGVEQISPILHLDGQLTYQGQTKAVTVEGVYSTYPEAALVAGTNFTDDTNMPFFLMNEAAAKLFSEDGTQALAVQENLTFSYGGKESAAQVCGIFRDEASQPRIYMSYKVAQRCFEESASGLQLAVRLTNRGAAASVIPTLRRMGIYFPEDSNGELAWELLRQQAWQSSLMGVMAAFCSAILMRGKLQQEQNQFRAECANLLMAGLTAASVKKIRPLRIAFTEAAAFLAAALLALTAGSFSSIALAAAVLLAILHACLCQIGIA